MHNWTSPTTIKRKNHHTWRHVPAWDHRHVGMTAVCLLSKVEKGGFHGTQGMTLAEQSEKGEAPYGGKQLQHSLAQWVTRGKKANCSTLLRRIARLKIVNSESGRGSDFLPRKVFTTGLMSSCRIQHESHTCSDLSYRIVMWNASNMQKTFH
jgi:hypothetical protein